MIRIEPIFARRLRRVSLACSIFAATLALTGLCGWIFSLPKLTTLFAGLATMKVNTAVCLLLAATAMILRNRVPRGSLLDHLADFLATLAVIISGLTLAQYATGSDFGIDRLLYNDTAIPGHGHPGRMSIATAASIFLISGGVVMLDRTTRFAQMLAIGGLLIAMLGLLGYAYGIQSLYRIFAFASMALHTAAALGFIGAAQLTARPKRSLHQLIVSSSHGGQLTRRLLPATVLVPLLIGWFRLKGQQAGYYDTEFGVAIFALSVIIILTGIVWWNATLLDKTDRQRDRIETDRDMLLRREQEARVRAEKALLARDQLLAIVSHELRTPLTPALLTATALKSRVDLPADVTEDLQLIHEQIEIEARLVTDLLDMAGLNQGKMTIKTDAVDLRDIARSVGNLFEPQLAEKNIQFAMELDARSTRLHGDAMRLKQVLSNLIGNAIKFTPDGGRVTLRLNDGPGEQLVIDVIDSGVGIEPEALKRIFEAFEQGDATTTRRFGGLGVGLTISKLLVGLHGGTLTASSAGTDKGATFTIRLPRSATPLPATTTPTPNEPVTRRLSILIVDDNVQTTKALERLLRTRGFEITNANTATDAIAAVRQRPFDLLISDIGLPDMSGWELIRELREIRPLRGIALSGFTEAEDHARSLAAGFRLHLGKPLDLQELLAAIQTATADLSSPGDTSEPAAMLAT